MDKVFFVGNVFGGDDGIGPYLYTQIKDDPRLKGYELIEAGVIGFDMLTSIGDAEKIIIVDAAKGSKTGKVKSIEPEDLKAHGLVCEHDFGVEHVAEVMRMYAPQVKLKIIGIEVMSTESFCNKLSDQMLSGIESTKEKVIKKIIEIMEA